MDEENIILLGISACIAGIILLKVTGINYLDTSTRQGAATALLMIGVVVVAVYAGYNYGLMHYVGVLIGGPIVLWVGNLIYTAVKPNSYTITVPTDPPETYTFPSKAALEHFKREARLK